MNFKLRLNKQGIMELQEKEQGSTFKTNIGPFNLAERGDKAYFSFAYNTDDMDKI